MPKLKNPRHELYAKFRALGETQTDAASYAGYKEGKAAACTSVKLEKLPAIQKRITEFQAGTSRRMQKKVMSALERKIRLTEFAGTNLIDFVDESGGIHLDKSKAGIGAIAEYTVRETEHGTQKTIKLRDPIASIDLLNKMDKMYSDNTVTHNDIKILVVYDDSDKREDCNRQIEKAAHQATGIQVIEG